VAKGQMKQKKEAKKPKPDKGKPASAVNAAFGAGAKLPPGKKKKT